MSDKELIELVASIWVANGGDRLGFIYCYDKIANAILEKTEEATDAKEK